MLQPSTGSRPGWARLGAWISAHAHAAVPCKGWYGAKLSDVFKVVYTTLGVMSVTPFFSFDSDVGLPSRIIDLDGQIKTEVEQGIVSAFPT